MTKSDKEYFAHPYLNNSGLSATHGWRPDPAVLAFGSLTHAAILEFDRLDVLQNTLDGDPVPAEDMVKALKMRAAFYGNSQCKSFAGFCEKEVVMYNPNTRFEYNGIIFHLNTKRKYDLWLKSLNYGGDIKTTSAETREQFMQHIDTFNYDRGRVFYSYGSGSERDIIIGISKVNFNVFVVPMQKGDRIWKRGEAKLKKVAYDYFYNSL